MTEVPEHLLRRAQAAKEKAGRGFSDAPAETPPTILAGRTAGRSVVGKRFVPIPPPPKRTAADRHAEMVRGHSDHKLKWVWFRAVLGFRFWSAASLALMILGFWVDWRFLPFVPIGAVFAFGYLYAIGILGPERARRRRIESEGDDDE